MSNDIANKKFWHDIRLTDTIFITCLPIFVYFLKFIYDIGYGSYFGIPAELISFSFQSVFISTLTLSILLFILYGTIGQTISNWLINQKAERGIEPLLHNLFLLVAISACIFFIAYDTSAISIIYIFLTFLALFTVRHFLWPIISQRNVTGYRNKIDKNIEAVFVWHKNLSDLFAFPLDLILFRKTFIAILVVGALAIVFALGLANAQRQTKFFILADSPQWVVARFVDNRVVLIEVKDGSQTGKMRYRDLQDANMTLEKIELGRIQNHE